MERIQSAIEKARRARHGDAATTDTAESAAKRARPQPKAKTVEPDAATTAAQKDSSDRSEVWKTVPVFDANKKVLERNRVVAYKGGPTTVPYDMMRTKLMQKLRGEGWTRVAITSPSAGAGKTMTCANLAFSLARQRDIHVMLIELDMRKPSLAKTIGLKGTNQFSRVLMGTDTAESQMVRYGPNLIFATNKAPAPNTAEMLQGVTAARILDDVEARYRPDVIIFDMSPMFASDDTLAFLDQVDCALLIGEAESSTIEEIDKCEQELTARTNVLGVMLNKCRYLDKHEEYGKQYGY